MHALCSHFIFVTNFLVSFKSNFSDEPTGGKQNRVHTFEKFKKYFLTLLLLSDQLIIAANWYLTNQDPLVCNRD